MSNAEIETLQEAVTYIWTAIKELELNVQTLMQGPIDQSTGEPVKFEHFMDKIREVFTPDYVNSVLAQAFSAVDGTLRLISEVAEFSYRNLLDSASRQE